MAFTPSEIKNKTFTRVKTGLEPTEVESYLEQLSNEIERLKEDKAQLEKVIEDKETNIQSYKDVHQSVSDALIQAKQAGEETKEAANKEADATIAKAKSEADRIVNDAVEKARRLSFQTEDMKRQSKIFRSRFRMLVEAQLDLLKNDDWDYLLNYDLDSEQVTQENINHLNENELTDEEKAMKARAEADSTAEADAQATADGTSNDKENK
ncbi:MULTISPECIES: DivIVA domain-containing protein [Staphylococcus]|jgi:cell division initiation protein|uniref:DivIVA domain-containing protein n=1 Tax=Staphylococcus TaxID=1279 RepID=UPI000E67B088|nr:MULTISPECIES: DivIVA domain-containing protein [Staphylococcus]MBO1204681.1 DivIVA domain-containing protein [Staphylococcus nepalensis]MBO1220508.1 DivIVA domain-containing protein [Staphylococcus nepalensis]MCD8890934.1 DivIVA domain-containing protein [Staphylococcus nepalensis]MDR5648406.1 DivIVA domain-containing protein [Staphylococcus nepalensis]MDW8551364.1 DivIVA domain-containing protein [Staphylococcus nepalensis]